MLRNGSLPEKLYTTESSAFLASAASAGVSSESADRCFGRCDFRMWLGVLGLGFRISDLGLGCRIGEGGGGILMYQSVKKTLVCPATVMFQDLETT